MEKCCKAQETGIKSLCLLTRLSEEVVNGLPGLFREALEREHSEHQRVLEAGFPPLSIIPAVEEEVGTLLSFGRSQRMDLSKISKKDLYSVAVKVLNRPSLIVGESRWVSVWQRGHLLEAAGGPCTSLP